MRERKTRITNLINMDNVMNESATGTESMPNLTVIPREPHESARSWVHRLLLYNIVHMLVEPGSTLVELELRKRLGVSRTPMREAFMQLAQENFITIVPQKGTYVSRIDMTEVLDLRYIRCFVEMETARRAAGRLTPEMEEELYGCIAVQEEMAKIRDFEKFVDADDALHEIIYRAAGKEGVWDFFRRTNLQHFRSRLLRLRAGREPDALILQHKNIVAALVKGKPDRAAEEIQKHLSDSNWNAGSVREMFPDYITPPKTTGTPSML